MKKAKRFELISLFVSILAILFALSSQAFAEEVVEVVVKKGDCLIKIVEEYLEDPHQWKEVARINRLKNPDLIYPDQILIIPVGLLRGIPVDGVVAFVQGDVMIQAKGTEEWNPLRLHDRVKEGSKIKTGDKCAIEIVFSDGFSCFQKSNTVAGFLKVRKKGDAHEEILSLQKGRIITRILKATGRESRFEIQTPSAVCAARGTIFRTSVDSGGDTRSEVLEGKTEVIAMMKKEMVSGGEGTLVRKGEPPLKPRKLLPPPNVKQGEKVFNKLPLLLRFDPVEGTISYRVLLTKDTHGKEIIYENIMKPDEHVEIRGLDDGIYFLHVLSVDEIGLEGLPSEPEEIRLRVNPVPPFVSLPVSNAEYREKSLQCNWLSVKDAVAYQIQIAQDNAFHQIIDKSSVPGPAYDTRELDYGSYYFRVRSVAEDGYEGAWSDSIPFTVVPPPPAPPVEPPKLDKQEMHIRWQDLGQGVTYHFQMAREQDFSGVIIDKRLEKPEIVIQRPDDPGVYYIHVSTIDAKGYEGRFSKPQTFTIRKGSLTLFLGVVAALGLIFSLLP
jgi:hypothetical protein